MAGMKFHPLKDTFAEVALDYIVTFSEQVIVHTTLFCQHGFALYQRMRLVLLQDFLDDRIMFRRVFRPMDNRSVGRGVLLELFQKDIQMAVRISLISQASSRKRSHSGSEWLILSRLTRTIQRVSSCQASCLRFPMKRAAAFECFVLIIRRLIFQQYESF